MGTGQAIQAAQSLIDARGTDTVLGIVTDKVWLLVLVVALVYLLGKAHGQLHGQQRPQAANRV